MSWLTNIVRPKLESLVSKKEVPDDLWHKCPACGHMLFHRDLVANLQVCGHCNHHMRMDAQSRVKMLLDGGNFKKISIPQVNHDPLKFRDRKRYADRLKDARAKTNATDAIVVARGSIGGEKAVVAALDFSFMGGSMGLAVGEGLVVGAQEAVKNKVPYIVVTSSGGARMQEGILSLMQMPRSTIAVEKIKEAGLPYIVVLADPTTGGVSASFAMLGDITLSEPGAVIGFAGARVIQETIRQELPEGFQRAEYLQEHGMVDLVVERKELPDELSKIIKLLTKPKEKGASQPRHK